MKSGTAKSMTIKAILFDKDGTLIDFADTFFQACALVIDKLGEGDIDKKNALASAVDFDLATNTCPATSVIVGGTSAIVAQLWQPLLNHPSATHLAAQLDKYFDEYTMESVSIFDVTAPALKKLASRGIKLGVATNDSEDNARRHLGLVGIEPLFSYVAGYDSGHGPKPEPGMVTAFARHAQTTPAQIAMVGDSINDLLAARNAGAVAVAVTSGLAGSEELQPYADHIVDDISQLDELFF
ncbi:MAG: HAD family hydrolase [Rhizobiaceae bacterium]|nr:HAD family hydrolase [Rhizobiaceae bacterium]